MVDDFVSNIFADKLSGKSYIDIGPLFGTVNETLTITKSFGAASVAGADIDPLNAPSWQKLRERCASFGLNSFMKYSINVDDPDLAAKIGTYDFVYCAGILYHTPSPLYTLEHLRSVTSGYLLRHRQLNVGIAR
ncbi:MAG: hypothetical protein WBO09_12815 [Methylocystis silviterrae]|uniref:hypothetical protein n=1 Tax=Methylocystis silviterrae TaxID=2743612 RepID=UPI003C73EF80